MDVRPGYKQTEIAIIPDDWNVELLSGLTTKIIDGTHYTPKYTNFGVPFLRVTDIQLPEIDLDVVKHISQEEHTILNRRCNPEVGDLLVSKNGTIGIPKVVSWDWAFSIFVSLALLKLKPKLLSANYLEQFFKSGVLHLQIRQRSKQGAVTNLHLEEIREFLIPLPPTKAEQEVIAEALSDADALIESLEQLVAKKRQIKQGAMQELLTGKKRLPGFSGKWKKKHLKDVLTICHGRSQRDVESADGKYPILATGGEIGRTNTFLCDNPSVLIGRKGTIDRPQYKETPFWTVDTLFYSIIHEPNHAKFIFYSFCLIDWARYNEASGVPSLNARTIENIEIYRPSPDEQTAIAAALSEMDSEIAALDTKLNKTRQLKQGMMQELLTGRIRLV